MPQETELLWLKSPRVYGALTWIELALDGGLLHAGEGVERVLRLLCPEPLHLMVRTLGFETQGSTSACSGMHSQR